jgi:predicted nucleotidyltransferase component of viral defense system
MDEAEYPGVRASLEATLENMRTPLKIDFSTGDAVTPKEISYDYKLMFENRSISILAYNTETILAEKLETILSRSTANTRMRDFYDIRILYDTVDIDYDRLKEALEVTCSKRQSQAVLDNRERIIKQIENDSGLKELWSNYQRKYDYAREYCWYDIVAVLKLVMNRI